MDTAPPCEKRYWFIAIGASGAEGLNDIKNLLAEFGTSLNAVVMIVLHRQFDKPSNLREILSKSTPMSVIIAGDEERLERGHCYIGEPASHLTLLANTFAGRVNDTEQRYRNRTVDLLFKSIAEHGGSRTVGVILSGSLDDGSRGMEAIHQIGGKTMVLLRTGPSHHGMPENAIAYDGPIDCMGPVAQIAQEIRKVTSSRETIIC